MRNLRESIGGKGKNGKMGVGEGMAILKGKLPNPICVYTILGILGLMLFATLVYYEILPNLQTGEPIRCAYRNCNEFIRGEGTQLRELWFHDRCFSELDRCAGELWGNRYDAERMEYIYNMEEVMKKEKGRGE